jgi:signal transduction histidine kinase
MIEQKNGMMRFLSPVDGQRKIIAFDYFPEFELYIAAFVNKSDETRQLMRHLIYGSVIVSLLIILVISITVYFMTIEKLHSYLEALKSRDQELTTARDALKQSEKLATMGQLAAGIAHEVNNPLGVVLMYSHLLKESCPADSAIYKDLDTIATQASRCKTIVSGLLNFARKHQINKSNVRLCQFVESIQKNMLMPKTVTFLVSCSHTADEVAIDEGQMTQVLVNLLNNSIDAVKSVGEIVLSASADDQSVFFTVEDNGTGISEENKKRLFEPFFSTKEMGKGTGLGLAVCYGIVKMHNGAIAVESCADPSQGKTFTRFIITLPRA